MPDTPAKETAEAIRLDMDATRARLADTLAELDRRVHEPVETARERVAAVRQRLDVAGFVRERPLAAALLAVGAGLALAGTGADAAVASGVASGTRGAGRAAADAARGAAREAARGTRDAVRERLEGRRERQGGASSSEGAGDGADPPRGLARLRHHLESNVERQLAVTLFAMRAAAARLADGMIVERVARVTEDQARETAGARTASAGS